MINFEQLNSLTGLILNSTSRLERVKYFLDSVKEDAEHSAKVELSLKKGRSPYIEFLNKDEIVSFLERKVKEETEMLLELHARFKDEFNGQPA